MAVFLGKNEFFSWILMFSFKLLHLLHKKVLKKRAWIQFSFGSVQVRQKLTELEVLQNHRTSPNLRFCRTTEPNRKFGRPLSQRDIQSAKASINLLHCLAWLSWRKGLQTQNTRSKRLVLNILKESKHESNGFFFIVMLCLLWPNYFTILPHLHSLEIEVKSVHETDLDHLHLHQHNCLSIQVNCWHHILQKWHEAYKAVLHL